MSDFQLPIVFIGHNRYSLVTIHTSNHLSEIPVTLTTGAHLLLDIVVISVISLVQVGVKCTSKDVCISY